MLTDSEFSLLIEIRKEIHANPELSGQEKNTQQLILDFLEQHSSASSIKLAETGVLACFDSKNEGKTILIRGDIDALPIEEVNPFPHKSKNKKVSHKCGHDGHTTILLGLAMMLTKSPIKNGKVFLLFQPAEETGAGAAAVLHDPKFPLKQIDFAYALHNLPGFAKNEIILKENEFSAHVKSMVIKLNGKTAHAAEPEKGYNPALAIAQILAFSEQMTLNQPELADFFLLTPVYSILGSPSYGISAGEGEIHFTLRSWSTNLMKVKTAELEDLIRKVAKKYHLGVSISFTEEFFSNHNNGDSVKLIRDSANDLHLKVVDVESPFKWGEDFGLFTQKYKGAMFGLGAGISTPALHNPDYDFPDEITPSGVAMFYSIIQKTI